MNKMINLSAGQRAQLLKEHRKYRKVSGNTNMAYRINAILLLDDGLSVVDVSRYLLLDDETIRSYVTKFLSGEDRELFKLCYQGRNCDLNQAQQLELSQKISEKEFISVVPIIDYVETTYGINYSQSGMCDLLHRLGFSYKKPYLIGAKAELEAQEKFVAEFRELEKLINPDDEVILFMDGVHPQHNTTRQYGWFKTGNESKFIKSNTGRTRINILAAIDAENKQICYDSYETISYPAIIDLLSKIEANYPEHKLIHVFADNAKYNTCKAVQEYLKAPTCRIKMHYLPTYSPNLNIIERLWHVMRKFAIGCKYFEKFDDFKTAIFGFLKNCWHDYKTEMTNRICHKFHLFPAHAYSAKPKTIS